MKVYVDSDNYEIYYNSFNGRECLEPLYAPLIVENIHDYTKQVRKEERIKINTLVKNWLTKEGFTAYEFDELFEEIKGIENEQC